MREDGYVLFSSLYQTILFPLSRKNEPQVQTVGSFLCDELFNSSCVVNMAVSAVA